VLRKDLIGRARPFPQKINECTIVTNERNRYPYAWEFGKWNTPGPTFLIISTSALPSPRNDGPSLATWVIEDPQRGSIMTVALSGNPWTIDERTPKSCLGPWKIGPALNLLQSMAGHFAVAASQLASEEGVTPEEAARYRAAAALLHEQAANCGLGIRTVRRGPFVRMENGETAPLTVLFASIYDWQRWWHPHRSIEPEVSLLIRDMLRELKWYLPDEEEDRWSSSRG
jgi:hypothetical protein